MTSETKVCEQCICTSAMPGLSIGNDGICSDCAQDTLVDPAPAPFVKAMEQGFEQMRGHNHLYHALVMVSGGKDSSYVLYLLKEKYRLRPLACLVVHPFVNDLSIRNAEHVTRKLGVDLMKFRVDDNVWKRAIRYGFLNGERYGLREMFGCGICSSLYGNVALKIAIHMRTPCVVNGHDRSLLPYPMLVPGQKVKAAHLSEQASPKQRFMRDALGDEYRGTIYDPRFDQFAKAPFPARISPLTFVHYDRGKSMREMEDRGILTQDTARSIETNCDLLHLLAYVSFKRYNCHPYVRPVSQALRRNLPTYVDQYLASGERVLDRDEHLKALEEYKSALFFVAGHPKATRQDLAGLQSQLPFLRELMGADVLPAFLERMKTMHDLADYLEIDLASAEKTANT